MASYSAAFIHYGPLALTINAVTQVQAQSVPPRSVVVVDNQVLGEDDLAALTALGVEVVSPGRNTGYAGGFNRCLDWFGGQESDALWVLNSDVFLRPDAAEKFLAAQQTTPVWDVMGSLVTQDNLVWFGGGAYSRRTGRASQLRFGEPIPAEPANPAVVPVDWINGCSIWVNAHGAGADRRLDEHFFLYREELEWQVREPALTSVLLELALVDHEAGAVTGGAGQGLGLTFMARNAWIMALRARGLDRLLHVLAWGLDFVAAPLKRRNWPAVRTAVRGARMTGLTGEDVVRRVRGAHR